MFERRACVHEANTRKRILQAAPMLSALGQEDVCNATSKVAKGHQREGRVANLFPGGVRNAVIQK
jgi:hypothetical protein